MRCFYHFDRDAVGVCKSCQRALCHDCVVELERGIACKNRCEADVRQLSQLIEQNARFQPASISLLNRARSQRLTAALFYMALGVAFIIWGLIRPSTYFIAVMGGLFVVYAIFVLSQLPKSPTMPPT
jgi:hypothetical protein